MNSRKKSPRYNESICLEDVTSSEREDQGKFLWESELKLKPKEVISRSEVNARDTVQAECAKLINHRSFTGVKTKLAWEQTCVIMA